MRKTVQKKNTMIKKAILCVAILLLLPLTIQAQVRINMGNDSPLRKLQIAEMAISNIYVDSVDEQKLVEDGIRGMIEKLDPHSSYMTAKEVKEANEPLQGNFEGIGVQFNMVIMRRLRGPKGTKVRLGVVRRGIADTLRFVITRDKIPVKSVDAAYMIRPGIGYIRIGSFGAQTHDEFCQSLMKLTGEGMQSLILDLQENGGGYLHAAVAIANEFLSKNDLIVYTQGRRVPRNDYHAQGGGLFEKGKVVVLIDSYSASAAEIVTGAIQDHDRGFVVGRRSYGKGLVQRPIDLPDGSMIRLTVAHYYTPSGRCIQKPYVKGKKADYAMDVVNRLKSGELMHEDSIHFVDSLKYYTLKERRVVYGGGGIMPDYYVPLDTTKYTRFHRELSARSFIINASLHYVDKNRKQLKKQYPSFARFKQEFEIPQSVTDAIFAEAEKQNIKPKDNEELQQTLPYLRMQLKALVARDIWEMSQYFAVMNETNDVVKRALELISQ